tara:strand:- start:2658 stop:4148 length:1491 start_codon:yes stop_codon:yes gene_type:complete
MHLNISQQMKMGQQMKLAPRMIQSMEILQLPLQALEERIEQELAENVCLERESGDENTPDTELDQLREQANSDSNNPEVDEREIDAGSDKNNESDFERLLEMAEQWPEDNVTSATKPSSNRISDDMDRSNDAVANISERQQTINEYLLEQFHYFSCSPEVKEFGEYLIQNLDHNGRLQSSLAEIVQVYGKAISQEEAEHALHLIQKCDPPGVGARDLRECLLLQLKPDAPYREMLVTLISSHLDDLGQNRLPVIQRKTGYSIDAIKNAMSYMRYLDPFPGRGFESEPVLRVTPDVFLKLNEKGKYVVELENEYTPPLRISRRYAELLRNKTDDQTKEYIKKKIDSAKWLIEAIEQRHSTLKRVAQAIVDFQTEFLDNGPEHIVPLKMQQIADVVGVHVTTVSRAVDDKWIQTPRGLYPLKRFFGGGTKTSEGEDVAWGIIRLKMKEIIDAEDKNKPLSDDALVEALCKEGYNLARRTVTKYRKAMNIPSSRQRRAY